MLEVHIVDLSFKKSVTETFNVLQFTGMILHVEIICFKQLKSPEIATSDCGSDLCMA